MADPKSMEAPQNSVRFHYIKSHFFRVVHADGVVGGITPAGYLHFAPYSERPAIPAVTEHPVIGDGLGDPKIIEGKAGFVRELEFDVLISMERVTELRDWLTQRIEEYERLTRKK